MPVMQIVTFDENVYIIGEKEADVLNDLEEDVRQLELFNRRHESFMQELSNPWLMKSAKSDYFTNIQPVRPVRGSG